MGFPLVFFDTRVIMRGSDHQTAFYRVWSTEHGAVWYLGYSSHFKQHVAWSTTAGTSGYKKVGSRADLERLLWWFMNHGYELTDTYEASGLAEVDNAGVIRR